jgi:hypothetical protein
MMVQAIDDNQILKPDCSLYLKLFCPCLFQAAKENKSTVPCAGLFMADITPTVSGAPSSHTFQGRILNFMRIH